ncbi:MAG: YlxR family protein [Dehalococcoidia bacterium]|nr:MAG: YlxR family protein [Dehalococcoidia bacterium]
MTRTSSSGQAAGGRTRPRPQRTCVACRQEADQSSFVRVVRTAEGRVQVDERGKAPGRGAYLHPSAACWQRGIAGALQGALRVTLTEADREALRAYAERFTAGRADKDIEGRA